MSKLYGSFQKICSNSIHPSSTDSINLSNLEVPTNQNVPSVENNEFDELERFSKSYMVNVRGERVIHVEHFVPNESHCDKNIVLFFLHGVGGSWKIWTTQIKQFILEGYEMIAFDFLGHGLSSTLERFESYEFQELALDVLFIFDQFCKRQNVLIGHSYGTSFCVKLFAERRNLVSKLILISGGGPTPLLPDKCSAFCLPYPIFSMMLPIILKFFRRMAFHGKSKEENEKQFNVSNISAFVLKAVMQGQRWDESDEAYHSDIFVPVLLIYGKFDQFVKLEDETWMKETIFGSRLEVIENAGHMVMIEASSEVNLLIQDFLNLDV